MKISAVESGIVKYNADMYRAQQARVEQNRVRDYAKQIQTRIFERERADRVMRNRQLELDKGRNIDIKC